MKIVKQNYFNISTDGEETLVILEALTKYRIQLARERNASASDEEYEGLGRKIAIANSMIIELGSLKLP